MKQEDFDVFIGLLEKSQFEKALSFLDELLREQYDDGTIWSNRGFVLVELKRYEESLASYDKARSMNPENADIWSNCGGVLEKMKRYEESLASYDKARSINPEDALLWYNRGIVLDDLKRYEEALESYDKARSINPEDVRIWQNRGLVLYYLKRYEESLASCDEARSINPEDARIWQNRGIVLYELKRYEESLKSLDRALAIDSEYSKAWDGKSMVYDDLDDHDEVLRCLLKLESIHGLQERIGHWLRFFDKHDLPFLARRVICDYELDEYVSWKGLIERTVQRNAVVEKYLEYLDLSTAKESRGADYWLAVALVHYYMGDPFTAYQLLDKNETGECNNNFAWQYYLYKSAYAYHNKDADSIFTYAVEKAKEALSKGFADHKNAFYAGLLFFDASDEQNAFFCFQSSKDYLPSKYMLLLCCDHVAADDRKAIINQIVEAEEKGQRDGGGFLYPINEFYLDKNKEKSFHAIDKYAIYKEIEGAVSEMICHARDLKNENALKNSWEFILKTPETVKVYDAWRLREKELEYIQDAINKRNEDELALMEDELMQNIEGFRSFVGTGCISIEEKISEVVFGGKYSEELLQKLVKYCLYKKIVNSLDAIMLLFYVGLKNRKENDILRSQIVSAVFVALAGVGLTSLVPDAVIRSMTQVVVSPILVIVTGMIAKYIKSEKEEDIKTLTYEKLKSNILEYLMTYKEENEELYNEIMSMSGGDKS
jgi:tetratricopeptide (TPR) repeat protein